ncbi:MAG: tetratricopeptide repeat protein [Syntrophales bacterium]|jgi:tetratricopeptide (TPR) repeat protein|nr:tetratricopeptide repeat protein [Syntrophales bacterium]
MTSRKIRVLFFSFIFLFALGCVTTEPHQRKAQDHLAMGVAFLQSGQSTDALRELFVAEKMRPDDPEVHYYLGIAYLAKELPDRAMSEFQKAVRLNPSYSEAHNYIGTLFLEGGQYAPAIAAFDRALANILYDTPAVALYNRGWAFYRMGDYEASLASYRQAAKDSGSRALAAPLEKNMGLSCLALKRYGDAVAHFTASLGHAPEDAEAKYLLAVTRVRQKNYGEAMRLFTETMKESPDSEFGVKAGAMREKMTKGRYGEIR